MRPKHFPLTDRNEKVGVNTHRSECINLNFLYFKKVLIDCVYMHVISS